MRRVESGVHVAIVENNPLDSLNKTFIPNKLERSQDYPISKRKRKISISISLPVSPSYRGVKKITRSAPVSPVVCGICITPPNSPTKCDTVVEGRWMFVTDYYSE